MFTFARNIDRGVKILLGFCSAISVFTTLGILWVLASESLDFFKEVSVFDFLFGSEWTPLLEPKSFGVLPLVIGTLTIVVGSAAIAIPLGVASAVYLSEYASHLTRTTFKPILEILAGIPTIVYGYFALTFITPVLRNVFPDIGVFNALSGSIVVGVMILPMVISLADDAFQAVSRELKHGGYGLGATTSEVVTQVIIPASSGRLIAVFLLALSRAIGETMAVTLAAGATPNMGVNLLDSVQTMTAYIVQVSLGDTPAGGIEYLTCFAVGFLLFMMTLFMNIAGDFVMRHFDRKVRT